VGGEEKRKGFEWPVGGEGGGRGKGESGLPSSLMPAGRGGQGSLSEMGEGGGGGGGLRRGLVSGRERGGEKTRRPPSWEREGWAFQKGGGERVYLFSGERKVPVPFSLTETEEGSKGPGGGGREKSFRSIPESREGGSRFPGRGRERG